MAAGVHDRDIIALRVFGGDRARVRQPGLFFDRERVHVAADENGGARAVLEHAYDAVFSDVSRYFVAGFLQLLGDASGSFFFLEGKLGMGVKVFVEGEEVGKVLGDVGLDSSAN